MWNSTIKSNKDYKIPKVSAKRQAKIDAGEIPKYPVRKPIKKSTKPLKRGTVKIAKVSAKRKVLNVEYKKVRDEFMKLKPICEFPGCTKPSEHCHHSAGRVGSNLLDVTTFKALCARHHELVEREPILAKELNLSINRLT